jgi:hypothetical protein
MTTQNFLSENRNSIITFYNSNIKGESDITLKEFMMKLMSSFNHVVKVVDIYSKKNLFGNLFELQGIILSNVEIGVTYSKPYSQSNHAKQVNYYGIEKTNQFKNI